MRKEFAIVVAIAVIVVSAAVAITITVANMSDDPGDVQRYEYESDGVTYSYDTIAPSAIETISSLEAGETEIKYDDGEADLIGYFIGEDDPGHAVLFSPNKTCTLDKVKIYGAYTNISALPVYYGVFTLEIWDNDYNLLYKLTDYSQAYFDAEFEWAEIDIPDINVTSDFYVCAFERASIDIGVDIDNPAMRSYVVIRDPKSMAKDEGLNWMIRAVGA